MANQGQLWKMYDALRKGEISRRAFLEGAVALGMALPLAQSILISTASAQDATPSGSATPCRGIRRRPSEGTEGQQRGTGGELKLLQWQAPTTLSLQNRRHSKTCLPPRWSSEPLIHFLARRHADSLPGQHGSHV